MCCSHLLPQTLSDCVGGFRVTVSLLERLAYFLNEYLCLNLERGPFYHGRRPMQYEYCCHNFPFSYSIELLLSMFLSLDLTALGNPDGSD